MTTELTLDDLPRYSAWPARLLGLTPFGQRTKSPAEVTREYDVEKWGSLLKRTSASSAGGVKVADVDRWELEALPLAACMEEGRLLLMPPMLAHQRYMDLVTSVVAAQLPATAVVELGAGYGTMILKLARRPELAGTRVLAGEYTASGAALIKVLADAESIPIDVARCDFHTNDITTLPIPRGAVIFTSYATPYVRELTPAFVAALKKFEPKTVIHFEPCYEHCSDSLFGLMCKRYIELNDYNRNLATLLRQEEKRGEIRVLFEKPNQHAMNPFLPASVIAWQPA